MLTRDDIDHWLQGIALRTRDRLANARSGDIAVFVAREVDRIRPRVPAPDRAYFHDQLRALLDEISSITAGKPRDDALH
ncbi:hypothetical protein ATCM_04715 [Stenotrophomonas sp. ATCM1_4]|nr:hypothetical protein ATCM_04715 [Stenotrophomonas sp. ATCM1_4]